MKIIDGKKISNDVLDEIKNHVEGRVSNRKKVPHLAAILVGDDGPSQTYVNSKIRACEKVGFNSINKGYLFLDAFKTSSKRGIGDFLRLLIFLIFE